MIFPDSTMSRKILSRGVVVQGYQIENILGQGGFGITYLATELESKAFVAIKEYFPKNFASRNTGNTIRANNGSENERVFALGLKGFLEEAKVLARLDHPNVIKVKSIFKANGTAYFVMEYCEGNSLQNLSDISNLNSQATILKIFDGVLTGLEHVHQFEIIHGDIKPANIFLKKNQEPVLLDFGSARHQLISNFFQQVSDGYSPPELYVEKTRLGAWTDIYGVGATFYKIITGIKPPPGNERIIRDALIPCLGMSLPGYDLRLLRLIDSCLSVDYRDRPKSVAEVRIALRELLRNSKLKKQVKDFSQRSTHRKNEESVIKSSKSSKKNYSKIGIYTAVFFSVVFFIAYFAIQTKEINAVDDSQSNQPVPISINQECEINIYQQSTTRLCDAYHQNALPECRGDIEFRFKTQEIALFPQNKCGTSLAKPAVTNEPSFAKPTISPNEIQYTAKLIKDSCDVPKYPESSRILKEEGKVSVRVLVDKDGSVLTTTITVSSGFPRLDQSMRVAVSLCRFTPGTYNESSWAGVTYTFKAD